MTDHLILQKTTAQQLESFATRPIHAVLLLGPDGIGKGSLARFLATTLVGVTSEKLSSYPYFLSVLPTNESISIEIVRQAQKFLQLKTTGTRQIRRVISVEHADNMTQEAQNALLKILEEPPSDTVIILTAQHKRALLPTILSRVQLLNILPPSQEQLEASFANLKSTEDIRKAYFLSGGLPGLMRSIIEEDQEHPLLQQVTTAKDLLQKSAFERLAMVDGLAKQKDSLGPLLDALGRIAQSGLKQAGKAASDRQIKQWHQIQKEVFRAKEGLAKNANSKLVLTNMFLNF